MREDKVNKRWLVFFLLFSFIFIFSVSAYVYHYDPFFHYHKPLSEYYYDFENERSQNDGITKQFDYDTMITGTSMTENFKTSEADLIFGVKSIKVPFSGGSYKEINDNIKVGIKHNPNLKTVIRCLDLYYLEDDKDKMRNDLGEYPYYLYNDNPFDDYHYLLNIDVIKQCDYLEVKKKRGMNGGFTSFDEYANWNEFYRSHGYFGAQSVLENHSRFEVLSGQQHLSDEERIRIRENIIQNVVQTALDNPSVQFYYYYSPYSAVFWGEKESSGDLIKEIEAEQEATELILQCDNIHLFSYNNDVDITMNLNNYKDSVHYGQWINTYILLYIKAGYGLLTKENYKQYFIDEKLFYSKFDYNSLFEDRRDNDCKDVFNCNYPLNNVYSFMY